MHWIKKRLWTFALAAFFSHSAAFSQSERPQGFENPATVEFRAFYPFVRTSQTGYRISSHFRVGIGVPYQFYVRPMLGWVMEPSFFLVRIGVISDSKVLLNAAVKTGLSFRPLPGSRLDPTLMALVGIGGQYRSGLTTFHLYYPAGTQVSLAIYSSDAPFQDRTLALALSGGAFYHFGQVNFLDRWVFDVGLGLRGSF